MKSVLIVGELSDLRIENGSVTSSAQVAASKIADPKSP